MVKKWLLRISAAAGLGSLYYYGVPSVSLFFSRVCGWAFVVVVLFIVLPEVGKALRANKNAKLA